jgi:voltage-gated potassium channel
MRSVVPLDDSQFDSFTEDEEKLTRYIEREDPIPQKKMPVISLNNIKFVRWCILTSLLSIWSVFSAPFFSAFAEDVADGDGVMAITIIVDLVFMFDILLNFRTSFINSHTGDEESDPRTIAHNYLTNGKLIFDLLSAFPYDYVAFSLGTSDTTWRALGFLRILRAYRLSRLVLFLRARDETKLLIKLLQLFLYLIMYVHVIGCIFFLIVSDREKWVPPVDTIRMPTEFYEGGLWRRYWFSFYHSVFLFVGVEIYAVTKYEYMFCVYCYICGAIINALVVGEMAVISTSLNRKATRFAEIADNANTTMKNMKLPEDLQLRIFDYLIATQNILEYKDELERFEKIIPPSMQQEVRSKIYRSIVDNNLFFSENPALSQSITKLFKTRFCQPDEALTNTGDDSDGMFFIASGKCEVEIYDEHKVPHITRYLKSGDYFGEVGLIFKTKRTATVRTAVYSNLAAVSSSDFYALASQFPDIVEHLKDNISKYKDCWRCFLLNAINKVSYLRNLSRELQDSLIYSLESHSYDANTKVIKEGDKPADIIIVVEGSLVYKLKIKSSDIVKFQNEHPTDEEDLDKPKQSNWQRMMHEAELSRINTRSRLTSNVVPASDTQASLVRVELGCVLNANLALTGCVQACSLETAEQSTVLKLSMEKVERLSKTNWILRSQMDKVKGFLTVYDNSQKDYIKKVPNIDCIQHFPPGEARYRKRAWRSNLKIKNAIVRVICRNREIKRSGIPNIQNLCYKLRAVIEAEEKGMHKLAKEIAKGDIDPDVMSTVELLSIEEISRPLLKKFASVAMKSKSMVGSLNDKFSSVTQMLEELQTKVQLCSGEINEFSVIVAGIEKLVDSRARRL